VGFIPFPFFGKRAAYILGLLFLHPFGEGGKREGLHLGPAFLSILPSSLKEGKRGAHNLGPGFRAGLFRAGSFEGGKS